jgi:hypothetical protein
MSDNLSSIEKIPVSDSIKILISLVEVAQKRGCYTIDESYLAYNAIMSFTDDKNYMNAYNLIKTKLEAANKPLQSNL